MRGLLLLIALVNQVAGITPAGAGTTDFYLKKEKSMQDHPRWCGDYLAILLESFASTGSPPLVRGLPYLTPLR